MMRPRATLLATAILLTTLLTPVFPPVPARGQDEADEPASRGDWIYLGALLTETGALLLAIGVSLRGSINPHTGLRSKLRLRRRRKPGP